MTMKVRMCEAKDFNASTIFWQANTTNPSGQVTQETLGNGVVTNKTFDAVTGWVSSIQSGLSSGSALQNESYLFDLVGNLTQRQNSNAGLTENFYYDNLYRLDHSVLGAATNLSLSYDAMGNITSRSDIASGVAWTYDPSKKHAVRQAGSASYTYTYDANGNAQTRNGYNISWTSYNYPSVINGPNKTLTFSYGPDRQRFRQVYTNGSTTETTMYVGGMLEKVTAAGITDWRHYISANGQTVAVMSRLSSGTNTTRYILEDHQDSIAQITDAAGNSYVSESFTAFGQRRDAANWSSACNCTDLAKMKSVTRMGYTGQEAIGGVSMGLNHMNGRVQDATTGRFLSPDPYVTEPGNTQGFNRYAYVMNNPLSFTDPSGFDGMQPSIGAVDPNARSYSYNDFMGMASGGFGGIAFGPNIGPRPDVWSMRLFFAYAPAGTLPGAPTDTPRPIPSLRGLGNGGESTGGGANNLAGIRIAANQGIIQWEADPDNPYRASSTFKRVFSGTPAEVQLTTHIMAINTGASPVYEQLFGNELNLPGGRGQLYDVYILGQWQNPLNPGLTPGRIANVRGSNDYYFSPYHYKPGPGVPDVWVKVSFPAYKRDSG